MLRVVAAAVATYITVAQKAPVMDFNDGFLDMLGDGDMQGWEETMDSDGRKLSANSTMRSTSTTGSAVSSTMSATMSTTMPASAVGNSTSPPPPPPARAEIKGSIKMTVNDPVAFASDPLVNKAIASTIAKKVGVEQDLVKVTLTVVNTRRLSAAGLASRRLQGGSVAADYTITIPANTAAPTADGGDAAAAPALDIDTIAATLKETKVEDFQTALATEMAEVGAPAFTVTVDAVEEPAVEIVATTSVVRAATDAAGPRAGSSLLPAALGGLLVIVSGAA